MRVLVCGSRTFADAETMNSVLLGLRARHAPMGLTIIEGGAKGADEMAGAWRVCHLEDVDLEVYLADWATHGKAAGPIRNARMLKEGEPDLVVAFTDKPLKSSRGTYDMVLKARTAGVKVIAIEVIS